MLAYAAHAGQMYGSVPYVSHVDAVAAICRDYGEVCEASAYLHDAVEDTDLESGDIARIVSFDVARVVSLVTDPPGPTRRVRKMALYENWRCGSKTSRSRRDAVIVKVADRLCNVRACLDGGDIRRLSMYIGEHSAFAEAFLQHADRPAIIEDLESMMEDARIACSS
jgi:(p)ppGpp synthase/HD superfamily hydrolase